MYVCVYIYIYFRGVCLEEEVVPEEEDDVVFLERKKLIEWLAYRVGFFVCLF